MQCRRLWPSGRFYSPRPRRPYIPRYMPGSAVYRYRPEIGYLYEGWHLKERDGQRCPAGEFPLVYS